MSSPDPKTHAVGVARPARSLRTLERDQANCVSSVCVVIAAIIALFFVVFATASPWWLAGTMVGDASGTIIASSPFAASFVSLSESGAVSALPPQFTQIITPLCPTCVTIKLSLTTVWYSQITSSMACNALSPMYVYWANVYGYCSAGEYQAPSQPIQTQGLMIAACVFGFLASIAACAYGAGAGPRRAVGIAAAALASLTWILVVAGFSLFASWSWTKNLVAGNAGTVPAFLSLTGNDASGVEAVNVPNVPIAVGVYMNSSGAFALAILAFVFYFFLSMFIVLDLYTNDEEDAIRSNKAAQQAQAPPAKPDVEAQAPAQPQAAPAPAPTEATAIQTV